MNEVPTEPFGKKAKHFMETRVLHRDVRIILEGVHKFSNLSGSIYYPGGETTKELVVQLVENGLAKYVEWSASLLEDELQAKKSRLRICTNYVPPTTNSKHIHDQNFTVKVVEVVSADCVVVVDESLSFGDPPVERRVNLSIIRGPKMGNPRRDQKPDPYACEANEFLRARLIGRQVNVSMEYSRKDSLAEGAPAASSTDTRVMDFGAVFVVIPSKDGDAAATTIQKCLSLAANGLANLLLDLPYPDAEPLKAWRNTNKDFIANIVQEKQCFTHPASHKIIHHTEATSIATMLNSPNSGHFTIKAQLFLPPEEQDYYYMSCPSCFHNTTANPSMHFTCRNCDKPRCTITMSDTLTQMDIVAFGEVAAKILGISADDLLNMDTKETPIDVFTINHNLANKTFLLHIRKKPSTSPNTTPFYYNLDDYKLLPNEDTIKYKNSSLQSQHYMQQHLLILMPLLSAGPNTSDNRPTKRTTTPATTPEPNLSATRQKFTQQPPPNKNPCLSSDALLERASTKNTYQGTTTESPNKGKEHIA